MVHRGTHFQRWSRTFVRYTSNMTLASSFPHIDALDAALDDLAADYLPGIARVDQGQRCLRLHEARQRLDGIIASGLAEAERAGVALLSKQRTMAQFLASRSHCAPEVVRADVRNGLWVSQFSLLEEAMLKGDLPRHQVDLLRRTDNIRVFAAMQRDQWMFVEWVKNLEWPAYKAAVKYWLMVNDQDGSEPEDQEAKNTCTITQLADGRVKFAATLDPVTGAILKQHLEIETNRLFDEDNEGGKVRTPTQRRAKALGNLAERGAGRSEVSSEPLIHVVMSLAVLENALLQLSKEPEDQDFTSGLDAEDIDGRCELIDGTPLHPKAALMLLMRSHIRRQVLTAKNKTLNASEQVRAFPKWMKYIAMVESRGRCEVAGCDAAHTWLQGDHHKPFSTTQRTTLDNLAMLCAADNKAKGTGAPLAERQAPDRANTRDRQR